MKVCDLLRKMVEQKKTHKRRKIAVEDSSIDVNVRGKDGATKLMNAVLDGSTEKVSSLLQAGADSALKYDAGFSALDIAIMLNCPSIAERLTGISNYLRKNNSIELVKKIVFPKLNTAMTNTKWCMDHLKDALTEYHHSQKVIDQVILEFQLHCIRNYLTRKGVSESEITKILKKTIQQKGKSPLSSTLLLKCILRDEYIEIEGTIVNSYELILFAIFTDNDTESILNPLTSKPFSMEE